MPGELTTVPFVLMYHSVGRTDADPYRIAVSPSRFEAQLDWVARHGRRGCSMRELLDALDGGSTTGLVGLTFDDGYADFTTRACPALRRHGFTATVFVVAGRLGGHNDWDRQGPRRPLMTADQVRHAAGQGIEIGSHGLCHRRLSTAGADVLTEELERSREILEALVNRRVRGFCYPYGELSDTCATAAEASGYDYAVATWGMARRDRHALPRTYVGERDRASRLLAKQIRHRLTWGGSR